MKNSLLLILSLITLTACSDMATKDSTEENAADFYQRAKKAMDNYNYEKSIDLYEQLEARFPYGNEVRQGQLDIIYAYYRHHEPELAISSAGLQPASLTQSSQNGHPVSGEKCHFTISTTCASSCAFAFCIF